MVFNSNFISKELLVAISICSIPLMGCRDDDIKMQIGKCKIEAARAYEDGPLAIKRLDSFLGIARPGDYDAAELYKNYVINCMRAHGYQENWSQKCRDKALEGSRYDNSECYKADNMF